MATGNITMDRKGNLWVAEPIGPFYFPAGPNNVIELTSASRFSERKSFAVPRRVFGVAVDRSDNIWVTSPYKNLPYSEEVRQGNFRPEDITRLEAASNYSAQKTSIVPGWPFGVASDSAGNIWTANGGKSDSDNVIELLASSGHTTQKLFSVPGIPYGVAVDKHDNVWLTGRFQGYGVVELAHDANYKVSRTLKIPEPGMGIAFDRADNLWVADFQHHDSNVVQFLARSGYRDHRSYTVEGSPFALAFDSSDNLWAAAAGCPRDRIVELPRAASYGKEISYPVDGRPYGVAVDAKNNVWAAVADEPRLEVTEFSRSARYSPTRRFVAPATSAIGVDSHENVWLQSYEYVEEDTLTGVGRYGLGGLGGTGKRKGCLVEVSLAVSADLDDLLDILNEAARWLNSRGIKQWPIDGFPRDLIAGDISRGEVYVARRDRRPVGSFTLQWSDELFWPGATEAAGYIHRIAVRREARGLGIELLKFAERVTAAAGRRILRLDCFSGNDVLCNYYERAGFVRRADVEIEPSGDPTVPKSTGRFFARQYEKSLP